MNSRLGNFFLRYLGDGDSLVQRCPHCGYFNCISATPYLDVVEDGLATLARQKETQKGVTLGVSLADHHFLQNPLAHH